MYLRCQCVPAALPHRLTFQVSKRRGLASPLLFSQVARKGKAFPQRVRTEPRVSHFC